MENNSNNSVYYNYPIKQILVKESNTLSDTREYVNIILCVYKINSSGKLPFLQFLLSSNGYDSLTLPTLPVYSSISTNSLISYANVFLSGILQLENFEEFISKIDFDGFYEYNENLYLFFDTTKCELNIDDTYLSNPTRFALTDEIINKRNIFNIPINIETTNFFIHNDSINYLYDENNVAYENPIVGFVGKPTLEKLSFVFMFGESAKNKSSILGPYYYFTDFNYAIRQGGWSNNYKPEYQFNKLITDDNYGRYSKGGIVRFALFTGITKYIENMPNSPNDESEIKKQRLEDPNLDHNLEILTLRITDYDGNWSKAYDSVYLGKIELDDGRILEETPMIVLKDYNQQVPLSYHFIDKKNLGEKFDDCNNTYSIL